MSIERILFEVPYDLKKIFINYEKRSKKLIAKKRSLIFNIKFIMVNQNINLTI